MPKEVDGEVDGLKIPANEPFQNDCLNHKQMAEDLLRKIDSTSSPYVIAVNGAWGTGKTTLLEMMMAHMSNESDIPYVYFNAWKADWTENPLYGLLFSISEDRSGRINKSENFEESISKAKELATYVGARLGVGFVKAMTKGSVDIDHEIVKRRESKQSEQEKLSIAKEFDEQLKVIEKLKRRNV